MARTPTTAPTVRTGEVFLFHTCAMLSVGRLISPPDPTAYIVSLTIDAPGSRKRTSRPERVVTPLICLSPFASLANGIRCVVMQPVMDGARRNRSTMVLAGRRAVRNMGVLRVRSRSSRIGERQRGEHTSFGAGTV